MNKKLQEYLPCAQSVSMLLFPHAEVVVHDLKTGCIAAIFNNFSKRKVGDESLLEEIEGLKDLPDVFPPYSKINWDGRRMKSVSSTIRDDKGKAIGLLCINLDLSKWEEMHRFALDFMQVAKEEKPEVLFKDDWREKINDYVSSYLQEKGLSLKTLDKEKKRHLVQTLHKKGAFKAKNAANYMADVLDISRASIYNYLRE